MLGRVWLWWLRVWFEKICRSDAHVAIFSNARPEFLPRFFAIHGLSFCYDFSRRGRRSYKTLAKRCAQLFKHTLIPAAQFCRIGRAKYRATSHKGIRPSGGDSGDVVYLNPAINF